MITFIERGQHLDREALESALRRRVLCAVPPEPTAVLPASPTADSSIDPSRQGSVTGPQPSPTSWALTADPSSCFMYPRLIPRIDVGHTWCTAGTYPHVLTTEPMSRA
jgi:hypothetical protein